MLEYFGSLDKINNSNLFYHPFPHIVIENFLDNNLFQNLRDNFPDNNFRPSTHGDAIHKNISRRSRIIIESISDTKPLDNYYNEIYTLFSSEKYLNKVMKIFQKNIPKTRTEMQIIKDITNYKITPHCDRFKFLTSLFYLPDDNINQDIGTELYIPDKNGYIDGEGGSYDNINYPKKFKLIKKVKYKPNTLLIFIPLDKVTWHGVSQIKHENYIRKTLQIFQKK